MKDIPKLFPDDILELKKPHPCGEKRVKVLRLGSDVKIECLGCGHQITLDRIKLEKSIRQILPSDDHTKGSTT